MIFTIKNNIAIDNILGAALDVGLAISPATVHHFNRDILTTISDCITVPQHIL